MRTMRFDASLGGPLAEAPERARQIEAMGFDGCFTFEGPTDPFYPLVMAAEHTDLDIYTNVAIAFPRSPMHLAYQAFDLQRLSNGRFTLGLGTQIQAHIERRYSAVWGKPVGHMRELVQATKAVFAQWQDDVPLNFAGDYYNFSLLPPIFDPGPVEGGAPPIWVGAIGPKMTHMVAEVADGILIHPFNTEKFLRQNTVPRVAEGLEAAGKQRDDFSFGIDVMVGVYRTEEEKQVAEQGCRFNLGFYGSTPAYRVTLDAHGWGDLQPELRRLTKENAWAELGSRITDEIMSTIAVMGTPTEVAAQIRARYGDIADRIGLSIPYQISDVLLGELRTALG